MWYVEKIGRSIDSGPLQFTNCLYYDSSFREHNAVFLWLRNSETGDTADIIGCNRPWQEFEAKVKEYSPYGAVPSGYNQDDIIFVAVDQHSLKFLDYVESIAPVDDMSEELQRHIDGVTLDLMPLDGQRTLFGVDGAYKMYSFTLFQVMCFSASVGGWFDDAYYFRWRDKGYRVKFNDAHKARAFMGKVVSDGYNPVLQYASELRFVTH